MFAGTVSVRDRLRIRDDGRKITAIRVFERRRHGRARVGACRADREALGSRRYPHRRPALGTAPSTQSSEHFAPPTLETLVNARHWRDSAALHVALSQLAEQDPLINLRHDDTRNETFVSLYGEVQRR